jgi:hypothetical protein
MDYGSAVQRAGILTTNEGFRWALRFEKQHLGEICCIKSEFLQGALLIPDKQRIQTAYQKCNSGECCSCALHLRRARTFLAG